LIVGRARSRTGARRLAASQIADLLLAGRLRTVRCASDPGEETFRDLASVARPEELDDSGAPGPENSIRDLSELGSRIARIETEPRVQPR